MYTHLFYFCRTLLYHRPGYDYQGQSWPPNHDDDEHYFKKLEDVSKIWANGGDGLDFNKPIALIQTNDEKINDEANDTAITIDEESKEKEHGNGKKPNGMKDDAYTNNYVDEDACMSKVKSADSNIKKIVINTVGKASWKIMTWKERL